MGLNLNFILYLVISKYLSNRIIQFVSILLTQPTTRVS